MDDGHPHKAAHVEVRWGLITAVSSVFCVFRPTKPQSGPPSPFFLGASHGNCKFALTRLQIVTAAAAADQVAAVKVAVAVFVSASCAGKVSDCTHMVPAES